MIKISTLSSMVRLRIFIWFTIFWLLLADIFYLDRKQITLHLEKNSLHICYLLVFYILLSCILYILAYVFRTKWLNPSFEKCTYYCAVFIELCAQFISFALLSFVFHYIAQSVNLPYRDDYFLYSDQWLKLDWYAYVEWVNHYPRFAQWLYLCYNSSVPQFMLLFGLLVITGKFERAFLTICAFHISTIICIVIAILVPAEGFITYKHIDLSPFDNISLGPGYLHVSTLEQLRNGTFHILDFTHVTGLITFPSLHALSAILLAWAFWSLPWIRWPMLAINICVVASTPVIGGHYFVDILGGGAVVPVAIFLANLVAHAYGRSNNRQLPNECS